MNVVHKPTPLSLEGSFEPIVNAITAQRRAAREVREAELRAFTKRIEADDRKFLAQIRASESQRKLKKLRFRANAFGIASMITIALGIAGLLVDWIALPVALVLLCLCCIFGGWNIGVMSR